MATMVYALATGEAYSYNPDDESPVADDATLAANGLGVKREITPLDSTHQWDAGSLSVVEVAAPYAPRVVTAAQFVLRFTPTEFIAIDGSTDPQIRYFMFVLSHANEGVDLNLTATIQGLGYLSITNNPTTGQPYLAAGRMAQILA